MGQHNKQNGSEHSHHSHEYSITQELSCHLPYATFSVAICFVILSFMYFISLGFLVEEDLLRGGYHMLFHSFHYLHLIFATTGTFVAFSRFSRKILLCIVVSLISPAIFCTLSDIALPALAGYLLGLEMGVHICFFSLHDFMNVMPFMLVGLITGYTISRHYEAMLSFVSLSSHFVHILISSLAATFYTASYGFDAWHSYMGILFLLLVIAVVVPCTISDVVIPIYFSRRTNTLRR